ncbi:MAG: hypothetical protein ABJA66_17050 [Actinomycetota bacterium]
MAKKKRQKPIDSQESTENSVKEKIPPKKFPKWLIWLAICLVASVGLTIYILKKSPTQSTNRQIGAVTACQQIPPFVRALGFGNKAAFSTSDRKIQGLILTEGDRKYQHPSWKLAGSLAPITRDGKGNAFVAPAPWIDVLENKPDEQNKVYRVDGQTQEMKQFADLPKALETTSQNPFGVLGLTFDCDTNSLYVSSVSGSTRSETVGQIFQLSADGKVLSQLEKTDAIGLAVFNSAKGKRLYFGQARSSEIWSIALDNKGSFLGEARKEISLETLGTRGDNKSRRINFLNNEMVVFGIEFNFNLIAPTEKQETIYRFRYDSAKDAWLYIEEPPQIVGEN